MSLRGVILLLCVLLLAACSESPKKGVALDPDGRLLRERLVTDDLGPQALRVGPDLGRGTWGPDLSQMIWAGDERLAPRSPGVPTPRSLSGAQIDLALDPETGGIVGRAQLSLLAPEGGIEQAVFRLTAEGVDGVTGGGFGASHTFENGLLTVVPDSPVGVGQVWEVTVDWHDTNVEQTVEFFPEGGGTILANLISDGSSFFTFGYDFWPRLTGQETYSNLTFSVTYPTGNTLLMTGERQDSVDNGDGTSSDTWRVDQPVLGHIGLALGDFITAVGSCGSASLEIHGLPGLSIDGWGIVPQTYLPVIEAMCTDFVGRFGEPSFSSIRFAGVDERFTNGYSTPGLIIVPNYIWDDDGSGSFIERDFYLAHELSHQWWGNDVFIDDMRDAWLIEGMADYLGATCVERTQGAEAGLFIWLWEVGPYLNWLRSGGDDHPVVPDEARQMEPMVYYIKGAWVLRMLETVIGDAKMEQVLLQFRQQHAFSAATTEEFTALASDLAGQDLSWFFEQWLSGTGVMALDMDSEKVSGVFQVGVTQNNAWQELPRRFYRMPLELRYGQGADQVDWQVELEGETSDFTLELP